VVYGAGEAANQLITELARSSRPPPLAVLSEDRQLWGRQLQGLPIQPPSSLPELMASKGVRRVLLAVPELPRLRRRELVENLGAAGLQVLSVPSIDQLASGQFVVSDLRPVSIEELLGRDPSLPDPALLATPVAGRVVLVTGAGGSIGSELCRQIYRLGPAALVLIENNEFALYDIQRDLNGLQEEFPSGGSPPPVVPVLADVTDRRRMEHLLREHRVQEIFHAAAYKHVPLVESNVCAAVANNLLGTRSVLEASIQVGVERFTLISSDKAVRPTSVMGATKRGCELLVQQAASRVAAAGGEAIYSMVRFGNVLGSSGSVVPLFHSQIAAGGPVTVTHPEITRYFMTIAEAVQLVLQAAGMARGGEVFVLEMGNPVRIVDLARQMILLSGMTVRDDDHPQGDISLVFTGLRPGEKLHEELLIREDNEPTSHPLIRRAREVGLPADQVSEALSRIEFALQTWDEDAVRALVMELAREQRPSRTRI
jgi:FlaA1/EpsC-like NDP-sugar epimerase